MYGFYDNIRIAGIEAAVPSNTVDNLKYVETLGSKKAQKFVRYTGIERRHLCTVDQRASDLSAYAADRLLDNLGWDRDEVRVLVNITQTADYRTPSTAMVIQKRLGIGIDCLAFDVNLGCSAYASGLQIIAALLQNTGGKGLLLVGDGCYLEPSEDIDMDMLLFGDGASATAIEVCNDHHLYYSQYTDGYRLHNLYSPWSGGIVMDGNAILLLALNEGSKCTLDLLNHYNIDKESVDYFVFHQAQKIIVDGVSEQIGVNAERVLVSYKEYGNTSGASIPITLCSNSSVFGDGSRKKVIVSGFGVGLAWNSALIELDPGVVYELIETDYVYEER